MTDKLHELHYCAHNYDPLPVTIVKGEGSYVWDDEGTRYLDMMSAYSAVSHGHCHPRIVKALRDQAAKLGVISRAYNTEGLEPFLKKACQLTGMERALPMNTGAEAVETALKAARKWAYKFKGVEPDKAEIISCENNFHGRTIAIVGMSTVEQYKDGFGPFPLGFKTIPFGDASAFESAITPNTAALLIEPIQGEGGINVPPKGYLHLLRAMCDRHDVLLICDEIQTGLGRTGKMLACNHEDVRPDGLTLGKALGGGLLPVSLFLASKKLMDVFTSGDHGSTFGGYPLASAVGLEAFNVLEEEKLSENAATLGQHLKNQLENLNSPFIEEIRGVGLFIGIEIKSSEAHAREVCEKLLKKGILTMYTNRNTVRLAPPLVITKEEIDWALEQIAMVLEVSRAA
ncbi:MAG: ornithine--oxo-acid transaminase [Rhodospirillales bacterium]|nr:ornithine--oxo-acid transaminase [Rhodospirillales bacterium]